MTKKISRATRRLGQNNLIYSKHSKDTLPNHEDLQLPQITQKMRLGLEELSVVEREPQDCMAQHGICVASWNTKT